MPCFYTTVLSSAILSFMNTNDSHYLLDKIIQKINTAPEQKITFAQYMDLCLYDAEFGYYNSNNLKIGTEGDFFTSASISPDFAELLAIQLEKFWQLLGRPKPFHLVEMGAGEGVLASNILLFLFNNYSDIIDNLEYIIIEKSTSLKAQQKECLAQKLPDNIKIKWSNLDDLADESIVGCFFSNELIDAMPVHLVTWQKEELQEIYLVKKNEKITEIYDNLSTDKIANYFQQLDITFSSAYPDNYQTEVNLAVLDWLKIVSTKLKKGYLLTIDYGYTADKFYHPQRFQGTLKCYYQHRHHNNPYVNIGNQDITSHVNFTALQNYGLSFGLSNVDYTPQALFLMKLGLGDRLNDLSNGKIPFTEILSRRNQLHSLINPEGLGNFKVLLQSKNIFQN